MREQQAVRARVYVFRSYTYARVDSISPLPVELVLVRVLGCACAHRSATCVCTTQHLAVSSMMAHILYCLQHKLRRGTRAAKRSVRAATNSRILLVLSSPPARNERYTQTDIFPLVPWILLFSVRLGNLVVFGVNRNVGRRRNQRLVS